MDFLILGCILRAVSLVILFQSCFATLPECHEVNICALLFLLYHTHTHIHTLVHSHTNTHAHTGTHTFINIRFSIKEFFVYILLLCLYRPSWPSTHRNPVAFTLFVLGLKTCIYIFQFV